ncbi:MAG: nucleoside monophosphate kinase [Candidatus Gracilibacteria bacterium]|nr:nucleoside monophosphate kinase [Candidatus Gracilibacteria bacterium]
MKIVFTGIQGCGKGTQARLLVEKYGFTLLEMGNEFRKLVASGTELGNKVKQIIDSGAQVDSDLGKEIMENVVKNQSSDRIIYDGFIRNEWNKEIFDRILPDYKVLFFDLSVEKAKARLLGRMFDKTTGETFMAGTTHNPKTGEQLIKRDDDKDEKAILKRISEYEEKTLPIVEIQKSEGKVIEISANDTIENIHSVIVEKLGLS